MDWGWAIKIWGFHNATPTFKNMFLFVLCRESRHFEDIVKYWIFRLRTIMLHKIFRTVIKKLSMFTFLPVPSIWWLFIHTIHKSGLNILSFFLYQIMYLKLWEVSLSGDNYHLVISKTSKLYIQPYIKPYKTRRNQSRPDSTDHQLVFV